MGKYLGIDLFIITIHINNNDNNNKNNNNNLLLLFLVLLLFCCCGTFSTVYLHLNLYASFMYLKASDNNYTKSGIIASL